MSRTGTVSVPFSPEEVATALVEVYADRFKALGLWGRYVVDVMHMEPHVIILTLKERP